MAWQPLCKATDLEENVGVCALFEDQQIALFNFISGGVSQLFATSNWDPIGKANVMSRGILGSVQDQLVIASPLYKQHFSLQTGQCLEDDSQSLTVYPVRISNGMVEIEA